MNSPEPATGPSWVDLYQQKTKLTDGRQIIADEAYLTESMMEPNVKIVAGYQPLMPSYQGKLSGPEAALEPSRMKEVLAILYRYEGPFLDGEDAEWILEERERLHSLFIQSAMIMVRHLGLCGYYHDAIQLARHSLRFDPYREEMVRHLLTLLALDERRIDAIRYYDHWIGLIRKELGISPLPATRAIIEEIRNLHNAENAQHLRARLIGRDEKQIFAI